MNESFAAMLAVGGKSNSLGHVNEVIGLVLHDKSRLHELYGCLSSEDAWTRMRAADALEKVCRQHPDWLQPYISRLADEYGASTQSSILWHLAQIYRHVNLTVAQKQTALEWLKSLLSSSTADWIVAANAMGTLVQFTKDGDFPATETIPLLKIQQQHKSNAVVKRANKLLQELADA